MDMAVRIGMILYGLIYVLIRDGLIHQRYSSWAKTKNPYLKQVQQAHHRHHAFPYKTPSEELGLFLMISPKY
ncbi:unnamed protein product [Adineta ricciae]|nr:unnamed protein product [Adineta ricciae]